MKRICQIFILLAFVCCTTGISAHGNHLINNVADTFEQFVQRFPKDSLKFISRVFVLYSDFGAAGDGITDDIAAIP